MSPRARCPATVAVAALAPAPAAGHAANQPGPVRSRFGYRVFTVDRIRPAEQPTLAEATEDVRELLTVERRTAAALHFERDLSAKWRPRTTCRAGFVMELCGNAPNAPPDA